MNNGGLKMTLEALLRALVEAIGGGNGWPDITLKQLQLAEWMATPTWERPPTERSLAGWCAVYRVPGRTARYWRKHPNVVAAAAIIADLSLGAGLYDARVWQNLIKRTAIDTEAIRVYFELRGKLHQRGGGVNVYTGSVDARKQGLVIPVDDADSYHKALELFEDGGSSDEREGG